MNTRSMANKSVWGMFEKSVAKRFECGVRRKMLFIS